MKDLTYFTTGNFYSSLQKFFADLNIPVNTFSEHPTTAKEQLEKTYKPDNPAHQMMGDIYFLGMVDDSAFKGNKSSAKLTDIKSDYDGILIFGVELSSKKPTRSQIAEITRSFNREYYYTPVVIVFKYDTHISFANCERLKYKQTWREGEKTGKVALLKDINLENTHAAHIKILEGLSIIRAGKGSVSSYHELYKHWQKVFSVSILSKSFYRELANWYFWTLKNVEFPADTEPDKEIRNPTNVIRLITRLMFIWFIKEKGLVNENLFDESELKNILKLNDENSSVYYKAILQNLFFATLNQEMGKREFRKNGQHYNVTNLYRYRPCFKNPDQALTLFENIPFLNGGLFECLDKPHETQKGPQGGNKIIRVDGFSDHKDNVLKVPNFLFFGEEREEDLSGDYGDKKKKKEKVKGLIHILNSYKFTIAENTPVEEEIALDPELLGKVFENLLASYNPETQTTARKQTGSFYTPREIVTYMVDESLIAYLKNKFKQVYPEIEEKELDKNLHILLGYSTTQPFTKSNHKEFIIKAIGSIQILDPACGSGAFPMGALHQMVHVLNKLDPENSYWRELQKQKAIKETEEAYQIGDKEERRNRLLEIDDTFENNASDYGRKLYLIENCIYGVDIQPIAVQIAKLRFFISLVVDQKINDKAELSGRSSASTKLMPFGYKKENRGITPLPNLETKFVAGNTLISLDETRKKETKRFESDEIKDLKSQLAKVRHKHFNAKTQNTKNKQRKRDKELRKEIAEILINDGWRSKSAEQLANWDPYDQNHFAGFFDSQWMYGIADEFDIVIGNPPYVQIQKFSGRQEQKDWAHENYKTFVRTGDIYSLFYERGNMLLKKGGVLAFITSNKWMRANYGMATRKYFAEYTSPIILIDFGGYKVFESATVDTNILIFAKSPVRQSSSSFQLEKIHYQDGCATLACSMGKDFTEQTDIANYLEENGVLLNSFNEESWIISSKEEYAVRKRIEEIGTPLKEWDVSINYGIKTGLNEAFIISGAKKNELIAKDPKSADMIKPVLRGRDIKRYKAEFADLWLINSHNGYFDNNTQERVTPVNINDFPAIKKHLDNYWEKIKRRQDKGVTPYNLRNCAYLREFEKEKIVYPDIASTLTFVYDRNGFFMNNTCYMLNFGIHNKYAFSILNSTISDWYFKRVSAQLGEKAVRHFNIYIENLPIPKTSRARQKPFEILVDMIQFAKENGMESEASKFESVIDIMVYDLYFEEEMKEKDCYITDYITEKLEPFKPDDTDEFKTEYIKAFDKFCLKNKDVYRCLMFAYKLVKSIRIINREK